MPRGWLLSSLAFGVCACASVDAAGEISVIPEVTRAAAPVEGPVVVVRAASERETEPERDAALAAALDLAVVGQAPPTEAPRPFELADLPYDSSLGPPTLPAAAVGVGGNWSLYLSTGADRLEEDVEATALGLTDTFFVLQWQYGLGGPTELVWGLSGIRVQDEGLIDAFDRAELAWGIVGVRLGF